MARKIAEGVGDVHVTNPDTGEVTVLHEGDTVPSKLDKLVGEHATTGRSSSGDTTPAGPSQTPAQIRAAAAAQKAADEAGEAAKAAAEEKVKADAEALEKAKAAEAEKEAARKAAEAKS